MRLNSSAWESETSSDSINSSGQLLDIAVDTLTLLVGGLQKSAAAATVTEAEATGTLLVVVEQELACSRQFCVAIVCGESGKS